MKMHENDKNSKKVGKKQFLIKKILERSSVGPISYPICVLSKRSRFG